MYADLGKNKMIDRLSEFLKCCKIASWSKVLLSSLLNRSSVEGNATVGCFGG